MFSFKYLHEKFSFPSALIGTLSADEIRIEARNIHQPDPTDVLAPMPANSRVKKLTITLPPVELPNLTELFRDVAAMCPELECFELVQDSKSDVSTAGNTIILAEVYGPIVHGIVVWQTRSI